MWLTCSIVADRCRMLTWVEDKWETSRNRLKWRRLLGSETETNRGLLTRADWDIYHLAKSSVLLRTVCECWCCRRGLAQCKHLRRRWSVLRCSVTHFVMWNSVVSASRRFLFIFLGLFLRCLFACTITFMQFALTRSTVLEKKIIVQTSLVVCIKIVYVS